VFFNADYNEQVLSPKP